MNYLQSRFETDLIPIAPAPRAEEDDPTRSRDMDDGT
jgi:hypothetical protein